MMLLLRLAPILLASLLAGSCARSNRHQREWSVGFWSWQAAADPIDLEAPGVDVLYVHVGNLRRSRLPDRMPKAAEYWLVFRDDAPQLPSPDSANRISRDFADMAARASARGMKIAGLQLDIDSPTAALAAYARYLHRIRAGIPESYGISITALLDWFRAGTAVSDVIREVDEFVPQFYDVDPPQYGERAGIAKPVESARWGPVLNRFGKPYRIGISNFGRARLRRTSAPDLGLTQVALNPSFRLTSSRNPARELVLRYTAQRRVELGYSMLQPGETIEFVLSTPETIRSAVEQSRLMGGYCAGVVFFRWPARSESLTLKPREVLAAAGLGPPSAAAVKIRSIQGSCAAVHCVDLILTSTRPYSPDVLSLEIRSSVELEYFLPKDGMPVRMAGPSRIHLSLPPYAGRGEIHLGTAVAPANPTFEVEVLE